MATLLWFSKKKNLLAFFPLYFFFIIHSNVFLLPCHRLLCWLDYSFNVPCVVFPSLQRPPCGDSAAARHHPEGGVPPGGQQPPQRAGRAAGGTAGLPPGWLRGSAQVCGSPGWPGALQQRGNGIRPEKIRALVPSPWVLSMIFNTKIKWSIQWGNYTNLE